MKLSQISWRGVFILVLMCALALVVGGAVGTALGKCVVFIAQSISNALK